jgi:hypothetical protein
MAAATSIRRCATILSKMDGGTRAGTGMRGTLAALSRCFRVSWQKEIESSVSFGDVSTL